MGVIVETAGGRIEGSEQGGVCVFRGIPYARPPVGARRLRPPEPAEPWAGVRAAARPGASAPQNAGVVSRMLGGELPESDEDCLFLDVWTPAADAGRRPVMVWIHGGSFVTGSGAQSVYDGARLARRGDVVVVTLNYRLGVLGFLALPALAREEGGVAGNLGLLDQLAALEWVAENAGAFGGDPGNVTLFGESAGAMSVGALLTCPRARGLFRRAILQSGAAHNVHAVETGARVAEAVMRELGLDPDDVQGLRRAPVAAILDVQQRIAPRLAREGVPGLAFQPVADGGVLPRLPAEAIRDGDAADVAILIGTNRDEWKLFGLADPKARTLDEAGLARRIARSLRGADVEARAARAIDAYRRARAGRAGTEPRDLWFAMQSDRWFRRPAMDLAAHVAGRGGAAYAYLFTWESTAFGGALGSCHTLEVPFVFGTLGEGLLPKVVGAGPEAGRLSDRMQGAWLAFARSGRPRHPELPAWPAYDAARRATLLFGASCEVSDAPLEAELRVWDELA